jgi:hypothetical protein
MITPESDPKKWKSLKIGFWSHFHASGFKISYNEKTNVYWVTVHSRLSSSMQPISCGDDGFYDLQKLHWTLSQATLAEIKKPERITSEEEKKLIAAHSDEYESDVEVED